MRDNVRWFYALLYKPLYPWARLVLAALAIPLALSFLQPLWRIRMEAPQYPGGLRMDIYAYKLEGGNEGRDIAEINELNHYIGMAKIERSQFPDLDWIPFAFGALVLLSLRAAAVGTLRDLLDLCVLICYVSAFSLARFLLKLYAFGHDLDPHAAVRIQPFMPAFLGTKQVGNFTTHAYPLPGTYMVAVFAAGTVLITVWHFVREWRRRHEHQ